MSSTYAFIVIAIVVTIFAYLFTGAKRECVENLPILGRVLQPTFWLRDVRPMFAALVRYACASLRMYLGGQDTGALEVQLQGARNGWRERCAVFVEQVQWYMPNQVREMQVTRLRILKHRDGEQYALSPDGHRWAKRWLRHSKTSLRDGEHFVRSVEDMVAFAQTIDKEFATEKKDKTKEVISPTRRQRRASGAQLLRSPATPSSEQPAAKSPSERHGTPADGADEAHSRALATMVALVAVGLLLAQFVLLILSVVSLVGNGADGAVAAGRQANMTTGQNRSAIRV